MHASQRGREAEAVAADHLRADGFAFCWRNVRIGALEIDLVAKKDDLVVIVEVRSRGPGSFEKPLASISRDEAAHLLRAVARALEAAASRRCPTSRASASTSPR